MKLLDIQNLTVQFPQYDGVVQAVRGVSLYLDSGESLGIVGESGSGKSVTCLAALRLLQEPPARISADHLQLAETNMLAGGNNSFASVRGAVAAMVFQDPMTAFDPVFTIGHQIIETIRSHRSVPKVLAREEAITLLRRVEIQKPEVILNSYPHQLSGGMLQRAMIAMALSCRPQVLFADEPTTALDVTIQAQILQLIKELQKEFGMGLVMITHDLGVIAETVDRVVVLYGGKVMEQGPVQQIFDDPKHPYTKALLASMPGGQAGRRRLAEIRGASPNPANPPPGCPFEPRCGMAEARCNEAMPPLSMVAQNRQSACWVVK